MSIFETSNSSSPNSEFFYLSPSHDILYSTSDHSNTITLDVPSYYISTRYGKLAIRIYRNLLCSKSIAKLPQKHIRVDFIKLFVNAFLKLKSYKGQTEQSIKFISALPSIEKVNKYIGKIEQVSSTMDKSKCDMNKLVKRVALVKVILFVYENYFLKNDFPFFNKYTEVLDSYIKFYNTISDEMLKKANNELKQASNLFSKKINDDFRDTNDYINYYKNKKLKMKNISRGISKKMFIV